VPKYLFLQLRGYQLDDSGRNRAVRPCNKYFTVNRVSFFFSCEVIGQGRISSLYVGRFPHAFHVKAAGIGLRM